MRRDQQRNTDTFRHCFPMMILAIVAAAIGTSTCCIGDTHAAVSPMLPAGAIVVGVPKMMHSPVVDGVADKKEWAFAARVPFFNNLIIASTNCNDAAVLIGYTEKGLYLGYHIVYPGQEATAIDNIAQMKRNPGCVRILIQTGRMKDKYFVLAGTEDGSLRSEIWKENLGPSPIRDEALKYAVHRESVGWEGEIMIPFSVLGEQAPINGDYWKISILSDSARNALSKDDISGIFDQALGYLRFEDNAAAVRILSVGKISRDTIGALIEISNFSSREKQMTAQLALYEVQVPNGDAATSPDSRQLVDLTVMGSRSAGNQSKTEEYAITVPPHQSRRIIFSEKNAPGAYLLSYKVSEGKVPLAAGPCYFVMRPSLDHSIAAYTLSSKLIEVAVDYHKIGGLRTDDTLQIELLDEDGRKKVKSTSLRLDSAQRKSVAEFPANDLSTGNYLIRSEIHTVDGEIVASRQSEFIYQPPPAWWGNTYGYPEASDTVPEPWEPVVATESGFKVWNRHISIGAHLQPLQIENGGAEMMPRPMRLDIRARNVRISKSKVVARHDTHVTYAQIIEAQGLSGELRLNAEFDGFMKYTLTLNPEGVSEIKGLVLEIPLKLGQGDIYYNHGALGTPPSYSQVTTRKGYGKLQERGLSLPFTNGIWVGTEHLGLQWVAESDQWWLPDNSQNAIQVTRTGEEAVLTINMVNRSLTVDGPIRYEWAIIPTPAKPINSKFLHELRLSQSGLKASDDPFLFDQQVRKYLYGIAEGGSNAFCQWAWKDEDAVWNPDFGAPGYRPTRENAKKEKSLRQAVETAHSYGINWFIVYGIWSCYPDWPDVGSRWREQARYPLVPSHGGFLYCPRKPFADWYVATLRATIDAVGIDGVYLDSSAEPKLCSNRHHGCGYRDTNNTLHGTYPVFAVRELHKRIYTLFHGEIKKNGLVYAHNSSYPYAAVESFVDVHHCGEGSALDPERIVPKFYGRPFGLPVSFTRWNNPSYPVSRMESWGFVLQVDSTIKAHPAMILSKQAVPSYNGRTREWFVKHGYDEKGEAVWSVWQAMKAFPWEGSMWIPHWRSGEYASTMDPDLWVCLHLNPGRAALIVVTSFNKDQDLDSSLKINWARMGFKPDSVLVVDKLNGENLSVVGSEVPLTVRRNLWRMIEVRPN